MTERDTMKCEECRDLITALACGEINPRDEARARAHLEQCPACKAALGAFQHAIWAAAELPLDEPSPALDERVMAAAAAALAQKKPAARPRPAWLGELGAVLSRLGDWAMSPQVAMASVLVLVVGIGLYALPLRQPAERSALTTVAEAPNDEHEEAEGTAVGMPVPPPEGAADKREPDLNGLGALGKSGSAGRFAPEPPGVQLAKKARSEGASAEEALARKTELRARSRAGADLAEQELPQREAARPSKASAAEPMASAVPASKPVAPSAAPAASEEKAASQPKERAAASSERAVADDALGGALGDRAGPSQGAPGLGYASGGGAPAAAAPAKPTPAASAPAASAPAASAPPPKPPSERAELAKGMQALTAGRLPQAIALLMPLAQHGSDEVRDLAQSLLAEALHDANRCKEALVWYGRVVARSNASARSLELAADCYAKTGRDDKASELRARARGAAKR